MKARIAAGLLTLLSVVLGGFAIDNSNAATYLPNCGNTGYLQFKPEYWSEGCTGGSLTVQRLRWKLYSSTRGRAVGKAQLRRPCGSTPPCHKAGVYKARARLYTGRPRRCTRGSAARERYFSRIRVVIRYRADNPFGHRPGWKTHRTRVRAYQGVCDYAPRSSSSGAFEPPPGVRTNLLAGPGLNCGWFSFDGRDARVAEVQPQGVPLHDITDPDPVAECFKEIS